MEHSQSTTADNSTHALHTITMDPSGLSANLSDAVGPSPSGVCTQHCHRLLSPAAIDRCCIRVDIFFLNLGSLHA
jgi:hypothetical protein